MKIVRYVVVFVVLFDAIVAAASIENLVETFNGDGAYSSLSGNHRGLDNPRWDIGGDGVLEDGGYRLVNEPQQPDSRDGDGLLRYLSGTGGFVERVELRDLELGPGDRDSLSTSNIGTLHRFDSEGSYLRVQLSTNSATPSGQWGISFRVDGEVSMFQYVPISRDIAYEIEVDQHLQTASLTYDPDTNDNSPPITFGPYDFNPVFTERHGTQIFNNSRFDGRVSGIIDFWSITSFVSGDFNQNDELDVNDIELLSVEVRDQTHNLNFDLNSDDLVNDFDRNVWVHDVAATFYVVMGPVSSIPPRQSTAQIS